MLADEVVGLATQVYKQLETTGGTLASVDDVRHVGGEHKGGAVPATMHHMTHITHQSQLNNRPHVYTVLLSGPCDAVSSAANRDCWIQ